MGLDDVSRVQFMVPLLALLVTGAVSGPASIASLMAWKWSLSRIAQLQGVGPAGVMSLVALIAAGFPAAYCVFLAGSMVAVPTSAFGVVLVAGVALAALGHAAYRCVCIHEVAGDRKLAHVLSRVPHAGDRQAQLEQVAAASAVPSFVGATRRRSLVLAGIVFAAWGLVAALLAVRGG
jgi:hypothetical protein